MKNTTNVFLKGMSTDLHPLATDEKTYTEAMNATLLTSNGNEQMMLNDMGNTMILDSKTGNIMGLREGFVPVGLKEHGGIMYIASVNKDGIGEIGTIPSPVIRFNLEDSLTTEPKKGDFTTISIDKGFQESELYKLTDNKLSVGEKFAVALDIKDTDKVEVKYNDPNGERVITLYLNQNVIDLGLPSGLLWALYNVGSSSEYDYGTYFSTPHPANILFGGGDWRLPTEDDFNELFDNCTYVWEDYDLSSTHIKSLKVSSNGNVLIFPASGNWNEDEYDNVGYSCDYWMTAKDAASDDIMVLSPFHESEDDQTDMHDPKNKYTVRLVCSRKTEPAVEEAVKEYPLISQADGEKGLYNIKLYAKSSDQTYDISYLTDKLYNYYVKNEPENYVNSHWFYNTNDNALNFVPAKDVQFDIDKMLADDQSSDSDTLSFMRYPNISDGNLYMSLKKEGIDTVLLCPNYINEQIYPITELNQNGLKYSYTIGFPEIWYKTSSAVHVDKFTVRVKNSTGKYVNLKWASYRSTAPAIVSDAITFESSYSSAYANTFDRYMDGDWIKLCRHNKLPLQYSSKLDEVSYYESDKKFLFYFDEVENLNEWYTLEVDCYSNALDDKVYHYDLRFNQYLMDIQKQFNDIKLVGESEYLGIDSTDGEPVKFDQAFRDIQENNQQGNCSIICYGNSIYNNFSILFAQPDYLTRDAVTVNLLSDLGTTPVDLQAWKLWIYCKKPVILPDGNDHLAFYMQVTCKRGTEENTFFYSTNGTHPNNMSAENASQWLTVEEATPGHVNIKIKPAEFFKKILNFLPLPLSNTQLCTLDDINLFPSLNTLIYITSLLARLADTEDSGHTAWGEIEDISWSSISANYNYSLSYSTTPRTSYLIIPLFNMLGVDLLNSEGLMSKYGWIKKGEDYLLEQSNIDTSYNYLLRQDGQYIFGQAEAFNTQSSLEVANKYPFFKLTGKKGSIDGVSLSPGVYYLNINEYRDRNSGYLEFVFTNTLNNEEISVKLNKEERHDKVLLLKNYYRLTEVRVINYNGEYSPTGSVFFSSVGLYKVDLSVSSMASTNISTLYQTPINWASVENTDNQYVVPQSVYLYKEDKIKCLNSEFNSSFVPVNGYQQLYSNWTTINNGETFTTVTLPDGSTQYITYRFIKS